MSRFSRSLPLVLSLGLFACSKGESGSVAPSPAGGSEVPAPVGESDSPGAAAASEEATGISVEALEEKAEEQVEQIEEAIEAGAAAAKEKATTLIEKITAYLDENKLDLAKAAFAQLETLKDQLPASYQQQIEQLRSLIDANNLGGKANDLLKGLGGK